MNSVVCHERYGSQPIKNRYVNSENSLLVLHDTKKWTGVTQFFHSVFLPQGYPESVSEDYLHYQIWDTLQAFASGITGTLAAHAVLQGVGVGDESATVLAATITWLLKSGTGMLGQIIFTWKQSTFLDCDCKRWRLFADILNDAAIFLEIIAPSFDVYFRYVVCLAGVCKSIVGVTGGATRAALTQHQARRNNMADVSAKDSSQETLVNLSALIVSLILMPMVSGHSTIIWFLYIVFSALHLFANFRAVKSVSMETFNQARLHIATKHYLESRHQSVLGVKETNRKEPVLISTRRKLQIILGCSLELNVNSWDDFEKLITIYAGSEYILNVDFHKGLTGIVLHADSTSEHQLQACYHAEVIEFAIQEASIATVYVTDEMLLNAIEAAQHRDALSLVQHSWRFTQASFPPFLAIAQRQGWNCSRVQLNADEWRADWSLLGLPDKKTF